MDLFIAELKRQMRAKRLISYLLISIILAGLWSWFIIGGRTEGFMMTGCYKGLKGMAAIETAAKDRNVYAGKMTVDNFQRSGEVFLNLAKEEEDESDIVMNDDLLKLSVYADTLITQSIKLSRMSGDTNPKFPYFSGDFGSHFYENEDIYYGNLINSRTGNQGERELALKMWNEVEKPYTYYGGFEVWRDGVEHIQLFAFVLLIMVGSFSSQIIAKDKECELDEIISTTKGGRKKLLSAKLFIPVIMGLLIYTVGMGTYIEILKHYLPADALKTSAQLWTVSVLPYNLGEVMQKMIILGLVGTLTVSAFTTFISSKAKKTSIAMSITVLVIVSGFLLSGMMDLNNPILKAMSLILPGSLVFSLLKFSMVPVVTVFGKALLSFKFSLIISLLVFLMSWIMSSLNYVRR